MQVKEDIFVKKIDFIYQYPIPDRQSPIPNSPYPIANSPYPIANSPYPIANRQSPIPNLQSPQLGVSLFTIHTFSLARVTAVYNHL